MHLTTAKYYLTASSFLLPTFAILLRPLDINQYEAAFGIQRRFIAQRYDFKPQSQVELFYGEGGDDGTLGVANITLNAPSGLPIVLLERFEPLTEYVDCNQDDGHMSLTFKSEDAFKRALNAWSFVNKGDQNFMVIANHDGCGADYERQIYIVTNITGAVESLTTHLASEPVQWSDVATDYKLSFGRHKPFQPSIRGRQIPNPAAGDLFGKRASNSKTASFSVNLGVAGKKNIFNDGSKRMKVDCTDCFMKGEVTATIDFDVQDLRFVALTASLSPQDLSVSGKLSTTLSTNNLAEKVSKEIDLAQESIPGAGLTIPGILDIGLIASLQVGVSGTIKGSGSWDTYWKASAPGKSMITVDALKPERSEVKGWDLNMEEPVFSALKIEAEVSFTMYLQPKLSFGAEIKNGPKLTVAVFIPLPALEAKMTPTIQASGEVCPGSGGNAGVKIKASATSGIKASIELPGKASSENEIGDQWEKVFVDQCFPLEAPPKQRIESNAGDKSVLAAAGTKVLESLTGDITKGLSKTVSDIFNPGTTKPSQTSGTPNADDDVNQIIKETFGGTDDNTATSTTTPVDTDINPFTLGSFSDPEATFEILPSETMPANSLIPDFTLTEIPESPFTVPAGETIAEPTAFATDAETSAALNELLSTSEGEDTEISPTDSSITGNGLDELSENPFTVTEGEAIADPTTFTTDTETSSDLNDLFSTSEYEIPSYDAFTSEIPSSSSEDLTFSLDDSGPGLLADSGYDVADFGVGDGEGLFF